MEFVPPSSRSRPASRSRSPHNPFKGPNLDPPPASSTIPPRSGSRPDPLPAPISLRSGPAPVPAGPGGARRFTRAPGGVSASAAAVGARAGPFPSPSPGAPSLSGRACRLAGARSRRRPVRSRRRRHHAGVLPAARERPEAGERSVRAAPTHTQCRVASRAAPRLPAAPAPGPPRPGPPRRAHPEPAGAERRLPGSGCPGGSGRRSASAGKGPGWAGAAAPHGGGEAGPAGAGSGPGPASRSPGPHGGLRAKGEPRRPGLHGLIPRAPGAAGLGMNRPERAVLPG